MQATVTRPLTDEDQIAEDVLASIDIPDIKDGWYEVALCEREKGKPHTTKVRDTQLTPERGATFAGLRSNHEYAMAIRDITVTQDGSMVVGDWSELSDWESPQ